MKYDSADILVILLVLFGVLFGKAWILLIALFLAYSVLLQRVSPIAASSRSPFGGYFVPFLLTSLVGVYLFFITGFWITVIVGGWIMVKLIRKR